MTRLALCSALFLSALTSAASAKPSIELRAELSPDPVALEELAHLTLVVETSGFELPPIDPGFLLDNLEGVGGPSRSQSMSWVNGQSAARLELSWRLRPLEPGSARVHQIRVEVGQEIRTLQDLQIEVVAEAAPNRARPPGGSRSDPFARLFDDDPFGLFPRRRRGEPAVQPKLAVRSVVDPPSVYVGEQAVWTLALDTQTDVSGFRPRALPELAGLWTRELELPARSSPQWVEIDGERFGRVPMLARALFPLRPGEIAIEPVTVDVLARMVDDDWIGRIRRDEPLVLATRRTALTVRPLPPQPAGFSGLVGELELSATVDPASLDAGQATTLVVRAATTGNAQGLPPPEILLPDGLRSFAPSTTSIDRAEGGRLSTEVEWRWVVLADRAGDFRLPPIDLIHFDPARAAYRTARTASLKLFVGPGAAAIPSIAAPAGEALKGPPPPDPHPAAGAARAPRWAIVSGLAVLAAAAAFALARRRRGSAVRRRLLAELATARSIVLPRDAGRAIDVAWRRALGEGYGLSRGTPLAQWSAALRRAGWRDEQISEIERLFEELHLLEFAPELADAEASRLDVERRARDLARRLR